MEPIGWAGIIIGVLTGVTGLIVALRRERRQDRAQTEKARQEGARSAFEQVSSVADRWQKMHEECQEEKRVLYLRLDHMDGKLNRMKRALGWPAESTEAGEHPDEFTKRTRAHNETLLKKETDELKKLGNGAGGAGSGADAGDGAEPGGEL